MWPPTAQVALAGAAGRVELDEGLPPAIGALMRLRTIALAGAATFVIGHAAGGGNGGGNTSVAALNEANAVPDVIFEQPFRVRVA